MVSRRAFITLLSSGVFVSSTLKVQSPQAYAAALGAAPVQQPSSTSEDWTKDSRWGLEYWKVNRQSIEWPNKARIAFLCSVPFETADLDETRPDRNSASVSYQLYGGKVGVWRILDILDRHNIKGNFITHGLCAVQFPETVKAIAQRGHELVGHFWPGQEGEMSVEQDRALIRRSLSTLAEVAGKRPVSWVAPGWNLGPKTIEILLEEGLTHHSNSPSSDDIPFTITVGGKKMVVVVQETVLNDNGFFRDNFNSPDTFVDYLKRDFERKYVEAARSGGKIFNFVLHAHQAGRPWMADALEEIISFAERFKDVWFTTRQPIAEWWLQKNYS